MKIRIGFVSNSSSSCFICDTEMGVAAVRRRLERILDGYNIMVDEKNNYNEVFGNVTVGTKKDDEDMSCFEPRNTADGKILIYSASDNTIPYELFDVIERVFNAERVHLG